VPAKWVSKNGFQSRDFSELNTMGMCGSGNWNCAPALGFLVTLITAGIKNWMSDI
jgi:hypothetical protein